MRNTNKSKIYVDALAEVRKSSNFIRLAKNADVRIRLAAEVYNSRKEKGLSQTALAKRIDSTQKVVSKIESGDTNIGIELLNRIIEELNFTSVNLSKIFNCCCAINFNYNSVTQSSDEVVEMHHSFLKTSYINY